MTRVRAWLRLITMIVVTALAGLPPALARALLGDRRASAWIGSRCSCLWGRALCFVMGIRRSVSGRPTGEIFVVASNHLSYLDILVLASLYPGLFVAKREIAGWPVFGWITRSSGTLFVDRERARDVVRVGRLMERRLRQGIPLTLFPEGMTTSGADVRPFLPSLLEAPARSGVPCFAVSLGYRAPGSPATAAETVCWWGGADFRPHLWRLLQLGRIEARVRFCERPIRSRDRKELARALHQEVLRRFEPLRQGAGPRGAPLGSGGDPSPRPRVPAAVEKARPLR